jgi:hypothetical protein
MGKTIKFNKKEIAEQNSGPHEIHHEIKKAKKLSKQEQHSKLHLKGHFEQQRHWPVVDEGHKGRKI